MLQLYIDYQHLHSFPTRRSSDLEKYIRYAGSPLKYSISEEFHKKGFYIVDLQKDGSVEIDKVLLKPRRDIRTVEGKIENIIQMEPSDDYVFVKLLNRSPILSPMEKVRTIFPNALHLERPFDKLIPTVEREERIQKEKQTDLQLFTSFYE